MIAYHAGALIIDQTQELRTKTDDLEKQTTYAATHDRLTDLPIRALFYDRVERAIVTAVTANNPPEPLAILLIEIENFKDIYDALGRNSSDLVLKQISTRLQGVSLERNDIAKIDGNVFGVLLADRSDADKVEDYAKQIQKTMEAAFVIDKLQVAIHTNIGIVHFPQHGTDVDIMVQRAGCRPSYRPKNPLKVTRPMSLPLTKTRHYA